MIFSGCMPGKAGMKMFSEEFFYAFLSVLGLLLQSDVLSDDNGGGFFLFLFWIENILVINPCAR